MSLSGLSGPLRVAAAVVLVLGTSGPAIAHASTGASSVIDPVRHSAVKQVGPSPSPSPAPSSRPGPFRTPIPLQPRGAPQLATNGTTREVFGFATSGSLSDPTYGYPTWNFDLLSTVAFFAIHAQYNGVLVADGNWSVWDSSVLTGLINTAHAHGTKVVVTIVGPGNFTDQCDALYNDLTTVGQLVNQVMLKGVDGVNIDYEGQLGTCVNNNPALDQSNQSLLTNFAKDMRAALDAVRPGMYLSIDTYSGSAEGTDGYFNIPNLNQYVDSFFVMAYDMDYANQSFAPLSCSGPLGLHCMSPISPIATYNYNDTISMTQYSAVVGAGKVILGQPYYGEVACVASPVEHAAPLSNLSAVTYLAAAAVSGSADVQPGTFSAHRESDDVTGLDRWDTWYDTVYGCWREMYWQDSVTYAARFNLVNQMGLRGVGFWTLNYAGGAPELWSTLRTYFVSCASTGVNASPATPQLSGTTVTLTATSTACVNPRYQFWLLPPGGIWTVVQAYSSNPTYTWTTGGKPFGTYRFSIWARDANSPGINGAAPTTYDAFFASPYVLTTSPCTATSLSESPPTMAPGGTIVTITGGATGCPNPSYQFWIQPPGGTWLIARAYATSPSFAWNTNGKNLGSYNFSVWAQDASSLGTGGSIPYTYDAFAGSPYPLTMPSCTGMTATATPASTGFVNSTIPITSAATTCPNPRFEFWLLPPGGLWTLVQPYSANATFSWNTAGRPAGDYRISAWARDAISPNAYDSFSAFPYSLTVVPCTGMSAGAAPATSTTLGTPVTITGVATGCPNPLYEFWMLPPGGYWSLVQPYSASPTLSWTTAGFSSGAYRFSVWARDASSSAAYDSFSALPYSLTVAPCTAMSATSSPLNTAPAGTPVSVTGSATGCPNPLYEFWLLPPGGTWTLVQGFSPNATFNWTTTGRPAGSYRFSVWARDASSSAPYDAFSAFQYGLT